MYTNQIKSWQCICTCKSIFIFSTFLNFDCRILWASSGCPHGAIVKYRQKLKIIEKRKEKQAIMNMKDTLNNQIMLQGCTIFLFNLEIHQLK